ncbi:MAG: protein-L-isoaspartate O-methyltransferase [Candidatus Berkelbacteria bacterium]|nr:protein-L-isoaspartate O-methyltransferase [Candidatus Berkelbacteria bacterium]
MTNKGLIKKLILSGVLKTPSIIEAFKKIDRRNFVLEQFQKEAYNDFPLPIGKGQTISQPTTVAFMLELLEAKQGDKILDVGAGSGWTAALLASIVGAKGQVLTAEIIPELVKLGQSNISKYDFKQLKIVKSDKSFKNANGMQYDRILVSAAAEKVPQAIAEKLKITGRLVIPVKNSILKIDKGKNSRVECEEFAGFVFVPLKH